MPITSDIVVKHVESYHSKQQSPAPPRSLKPSTIADIKVKQLSLQQRLLTSSLTGSAADKLSIVLPTSPVVSTNDLTKSKASEEPLQPPLNIKPPVEAAASVQPLNLDASVSSPVLSKPTETLNVGLQAILKRRRFGSASTETAASTLGRNSNIADTKTSIGPESPSVPEITPVADSAVRPAVSIANAATPTAPCVSTIRPGPWQRSAPISVNTAQRLLVQHIDPDDLTIIWAIHADNEAACMQLLAEINDGSLNDPNKAAIRTGQSIAVGNLVAVYFEDLYYRAVVLKDDSPLGEISCRLLDYGNEMFVALEDVKQPLPCMTAHPAYAIRLRLRRKRTPAIGETLHVQLLNEVAKGIYGAEELPAVPDAAAVSSTATAAAAIIAMVPQPQVVATTTTLTTQSPPPATAPIVSACVATRPAPVVPPITEAKTKAAVPLRRFQITDLTVVPLPIGEPVKLSCLDTSELEHGVITAAVYDVDRLRFIMEALPQRIAAYCNGPLAQTFTPTPGDLCLAVFTDDGAWYRAVCLDIDAEQEKLQVLFVDYGNVTYVSLANVRNISEELVTDPCLANGCIIEGKFFVLYGLREQTSSENDDHDDERIPIIVVALFIRAGVPDRIPYDRIKSFLQANPVFLCQSAMASDNDMFRIQLDV